jgi:hypothetical protein
MHGWKWLALLPLWVAVMNPEGISNSNYHFSFGEACALVSVERVAAVGEVEDKTLFLVKWPELFDAGTLCPRGTLFLWDATDMAEHQRKERKDTIEKHKLQERMRKELQRLGM